MTVEEYLRPGLGANGPPGGPGEELELEWLEFLPILMLQWLDGAGRTPGQRAFRAAGAEPLEEWNQGGYATARAEPVAQPVGAAAKGVEPHRPLWRTGGGVTGLGVVEAWMEYFDQLGRAQLPGQNTQGALEGGFGAAAQEDMPGAPADAGPEAGAVDERGAFSPAFEGEWVQAGELLGGWADLLGWTLRGTENEPPEDGTWPGVQVARAGGAGRGQGRQSAVGGGLREVFAPGEYGRGGADLRRYGGEDLAQLLGRELRNELLSSGGRVWSGG